MRRRASRDLQERPVAVSLAHTSLSTLTMHAESWFSTWREERR